MAQQQRNASQQSGNVPMIKSSQVDLIPNLAPDTRAKWKSGFQVLEGQLAEKTPGSKEYLDVEGRIRVASVQLMNQISKASRPAGAGGQPAAQQPGAAPAQRPPGAPAQQAGANAMAPTMQQQGSQQGQQSMQLNAQSKAELNGIKVNFPPTVVTQGEQAMNQYRTQWMKRAAQVLARRDTSRHKGSVMQSMIKSGQQPITNQTQVQQELDKLRTEMNTANTEWEQLKHSNMRFGQHAAVQQGNQPQPQPQQPPAQPQSDAQRPTSSQAPPQPQPDVKMAMDQQQARTSMSPVQGKGAVQQQQRPMPLSSQANMPQQQTAQSAQQKLQQQQQQQSTPQSATQVHAAQNFPQPNNMAQQQQQRAAMTAQQMMQAQQQQQTGMAQSATQPQAPPQAQGQQRPQALSHQAAMSQASFARQDAAQQQQQHAQQQAQQQAQMSNVANGLSLNPPQSATNQTPPSAYAHAQVPQQVSSSTKFPIPKQIHLDPRTQNPVQGPPSRPTFSNAGMMGQPGIQRAGQFTLEGEGDRVLSKRKLDELVRQVTGSTDSAESGGALTSDVEEAVLTLADDFVDNLITSACRLAKLRSSQTLDIRDIQIVLERNYGIRIPGYGLDEVRTVRKFQPAEGWRNKMQAVQAGKVMGSNAGKDA